MSWEDREGKGRYYTWTINFAGRRRRIYLGKAGDPVAELAYAYDSLHRVNLELDARARAAEAQQVDNARIEAGINAAFDGFGRMLRFEPPPESVEPGTFDED